MKNSFACSCQRPTWTKRPASVVIDSSTYLLMISSPDIDNVAMSLYDIIVLSILYGKSATVKSMSLPAMPEKVQCDATSC